MNTIFSKGDLVSAYNGQIEIQFNDDFSYKDNDIFMFIGPNGIGKSTLAKILTRFTSFNLVNGSDFHKFFLFHPQELLFLPGTVKDDFEVFLRNYEFEKQIRNLGGEVEKFYFENKNNEISSLSGGEKQLVLLLRTILVYHKRNKSKNIDGIVLDEPSKQLCNNNFKLLKNVFLNALSKLSIPLFFITHEFNLTQAIMEVFLPNKKTINFIEIQEANNKRKNVYSLGSFNMSNIETKWLEIINKGGYIASFFENSIPEFQPNGSSFVEKTVHYSYPFHSGLYKVVTMDSKIYISTSPKNHGTKLLPSEQICLLS